MSTYRTSRPLIVEAVQSAETKTIATDLGFINVQQGEWVVCGEGGECYIVDDAFFRRTFAAVDDMQALESGRLTCALPAARVMRVATETPVRTGACRDSNRRRSRLSCRAAANRARHQ
jgi:hypothetical protein